MKIPIGLDKGLPFATSLFLLEGVVLMPRLYTIRHAVEMQPLSWNLLVSIILASLEFFWWLYQGFLGT